MGQLLYREYLKSVHWKKLRWEAFKTYGWKCKKCGSGNRTQPHHHTYRHPWTDCTVEDLIILCRSCHRAEHGLKPIKLKTFKQIKRARKKQKKKQRKYSLVQGPWKIKPSKFYKKPRPYWVNRGTSSN